MGIFDDVVFNVKSKAEVVGKKAGDVYDVSKLKWSLVELTREISKEYGKLGKFCYDTRRNGEQNDEGMESTIARIDSLFEQKSAIADRVLTLTDRKRCGSCCEIVANDANFCAKCGAKFEIPVVEPEVDDTDPLDL